MKRTFLFIIAALLCCTFSSCETDSSPKQFNDFGISFEYPGDWKVTDSEDLGYSRSVTVEKKGMDSSGIIIMLMLDKELGLIDILDNYEEILLSQNIMKGIVFTDLKSGVYGEYECVERTYTGHVLGLQHRGTIRGIEGPDFMVIVHQQETLDDIEENAEGFNSIMDSFRLEEA